LFPRYGNVNDDHRQGAKVAKDGLVIVE